MTITKQEVSEYLEKHPDLKARSKKYLAISQMIGITPEQAQMAININRRIQDIIPNDEKGQRLEKEWRVNEGMATCFEVAGVQSQLI